MIQERSNQILDSRQENTIQSEIQSTISTENNNHLFEWSRILENISVVALQKFTTQSIGILSDKLIISLNVKTLKIERKIKPGKKATCLTIIHSSQKASSSTQLSNRPVRKKKTGKSVQFFTGHFDGTITMWIIQNNKVKQMKVFSDADPNDRRPVSCLNVMSYQHSLPQTYSTRHEQFKRYKKEKFQDTSTSLISLKNHPQIVIQYVLLSGHQNGNVKQWNILTGQCLKEIETKHNGILFCMTSIQDNVLTGGQNNIQVHQPVRQNSLPSTSSSSSTSTSSQQDFSEVFSHQFDHRNRVHSFSNYGSQTEERKEDKKDCLLQLKKCNRNSWSHVREEERQKHVKKEFKVIHKGFLGNQVPKSTQEDNLVRNMIAFDNNSILSHGFSRNVTEWKLDQNKIIKRTYTGHTDNVKCIEKLNDQQFITGGRDSKVIVWDKDKNQNHIYEGAHSQPVNSLSAMDENSFVSSGEDNKVLFWKQSQ